MSLRSKAQETTTEVKKPTEAKKETKPETQDLSRINEMDEPDLSGLDIEVGTAEVEIKEDVAATTIPMAAQKEVKKVEEAAAVKAPEKKGASKKVKRLIEEASGCQIGRLEAANKEIVEVLKGKGDGESRRQIKQLIDELVRLLMKTDGQLEEAKRLLSASWDAHEVERELRDKHRQDQKFEAALDAILGY